MATNEQRIQAARNATITNLRVACELGKAMGIAAVNADDAHCLEAILGRMVKQHLHASSNQCRLLAAVLEGIENKRIGKQDQPWHETDPRYTRDNDIDGYGHH